MDKVEKLQLELIRKAKIQRRIKANRIVGFIRFRDHFSTCPGRHSWDLCGHPVYWWGFKTMMDSRYIEKVVVCTEVEEALRMAESMSDKFVTIKRTLEECEEPDYHIIDDLKTPDSRVAIPFANRMEIVNEKLGFVPSLHIGLNPCYPLVTTENVDKLIERYFDDDLAECATLVSRTEPHLYISDPSNPQYLLPVWHFKNLGRRQQYPPLYRSIGVVISSYGWTGIARTVFVEIPEEEAVDIHNKKDLRKAIFYLKIRLDASETSG